MLRLGDLAREIGGELEGPADCEVRGAAPVDKAGPHEITFAAQKRYLDMAKESRAAAVIVGRDAPPLGVPVIRVANPRLAWLEVLQRFSNPPRVEPGVHETAVIGKGVKLGRNVSIQAHVYIGDGAVIGDHVVLSPGVYIGEESSIGDESFLYPNVTVRERVTIGKRVILHAGCVVGSDGFGYVTVNQRHRKVPHIGTVIIGDDVELGAQVAVDRGTCGATVIGSGTKVDNLVQIAHNVEIGENCLVAGQVGIAGSAHIGERVTLAGQVGVIGHLSVGPDTVVAARAVVASDLPSGSFVSGFPARPHRENMRVIAATQRLPELQRLVSEMERRVRELQERLEQLEEERPATGGVV